LYVPDYDGGMVGPPKRLEDLQKVDGAIRITCRSCKAVTMLDLAELIRARSARRASSDWRTVQQDQPCPVCRSRAVRVDGVPFGENNPELRARRADARRLQLALEVLKEAAPRDSVMPAAAIRLALRVIHPFVGDQQLLTTYWQQVMSEGKDGPFRGGEVALRWIVSRLVDRGWPVPLDRQ
jgi:hypothetical protein